MVMGENVNCKCRGIIGNSSVSSYLCTVSSHISSTTVKYKGVATYVRCYIIRTLLHYISHIRLAVVEIACSDLGLLNKFSCWGSM